MLVLSEKGGWRTLRPPQGEDPGVQARFLPPSRSLRRRARRAALRGIGEMSVEDLDALTIAELGDAYSRELIRLGLAEWKGIGIGDELVGVSPPLDVRTRTALDEDRPTGTIDLFLDDEDMFDAAEREFSMPIIEREMEKNGLSASPNGIGEAGTPAPGTASSCAKPSSKGDAPNAPTGSRSRKALKERKSGAS